MHTLASLEDVRQVFARWDQPVAWFGKTHLLCRGIDSYIPEFWIIPESPAGIALCRGAGIPQMTFEEVSDRFAGKRLDVLCLVPSQRLARLCRRHDWKILNASAQTVRRAADKLRLPALLTRAQVPVIPHVVIRRVTPLKAQKVWDTLCSPRLVLQTAENDRTGRGTFQVASLSELKAVLGSFEHRSLKAARFMNGRLLTISACATEQGIFTSCLSRQLVGVPSLTQCWSAHCGNECLEEEEINFKEVAAIRRCCCRVGRELVRGGFVGQFGLDLVLDDEGTPWILEINPRLQSISSLVHATEIERGHVPLQAVHILRLSGFDFRVKQTYAANYTCVYSQVVIESHNSVLRVRRFPGCGVYQRYGDGLSRIAASGDLHTLKKGQFLITPFCVPGQRLATGDRIAVVQWRGSITDGNGKLRPEIDATVRGLRRGVVEDKGL